MKNNDQEQQKNRFGPDKKPGLWDEYIGQYVIIYPQNGKTFAGKLVEIKDGFYGILSPFQSGRYREEGPEIRLDKKRSMIYLQGASIEPTTRKSLENYCIFENKKRDEKKKEDTSKESAS